MNAETKRLLAERDEIMRLLEGTGLTLHGWNTLDDFSTVADGYPQTFEWRGKPMVDVLRERAALRGMK